MHVSHTNKAHRHKARISSETFQTNYITYYICMFYIQYAYRTGICYTSRYMHVQLILIDYEHEIRLTHTRATQNARCVSQIYRFHSLFGSTPPLTPRSAITKTVYVFNPSQYLVPLTCPASSVDDRQLFVLQCIVQIMLTYMNVVYIYVCSTEYTIIVRHGIAPANTSTYTHNYIWF